jgi:hypothetical protein
MISKTNGLKADTYGWDTVFAIRIDDVNASIKNKKTSPKSFSASTTDPQTHNKVDVNGNFSDWQITTGGSGKLIHMSTPVISLIARGILADGTKAEFSFNEGNFEVQVELEFLPHNDPPANGSGTFHNLMVKHSGQTPGEQVVTFIDAYGFGNSTDGSNTPFSAVQDDVESALQIWFNENLNDFEHVFATVNLNREADKGQFEWLLPTDVSYAYIDGDSLDNSILGVLCMTGGRSIEGLVQEVSPNAIPGGSRAGFLISPERFITEMLWPSMPIVYQGVTKDDFKLRSDSTGLILNNGEVTIQSMKDGDGNPHETYLRNFEISTTNQILTIDATTRVTVSPGIEAFTHTVSSFDLILHNAENNKQTIFYEQVGTPVVEHWTEEGEGIKIIKIFEDIILFVAIIAVGVLTDGAGFVLAAIVLGTLGVVTSKIPDIIGAANTDDSPSVSLLTFNSVDPIQWSDQKDFKLDQVSLNCSIQLGGTPSF